MTILLETHAAVYFRRSAPSCHAETLEAETGSFGWIYAHAVLSACHQHLRLVLEADLTLIAMCDQQATVDYVSPTRRFFETPSPGLGRKLFVKRSSMPGEYPQLNRIGQPLFRDRRAKQSLVNEARAIEYVRQHTTIPVPTTIAAFEDRGAFYLIQEFLAGIRADTAPPSAHPYIVQQLEGYVKQLQRLRSDTVRSFVDDHLFTVPRLGTMRDLFDDAEYSCKKDAYVLCHGDLAWYNVMVDPETWKITAIFDWEFAGFYPAGTEGEYWRRCGGASAGERGDLVDLTSIIRKLYHAGDGAHSGSAVQSKQREPPERRSMFEGVNIVQVLPSTSGTPKLTAGRLRKRRQSYKNESAGLTLSTQLTYPSHTGPWEYKGPFAPEKALPALSTPSVRISMRMWQPRGAG
jgi:hypothetical protein